MTAADRDPIDRFDAALEAFRRGETPSDADDPTLLAAVARLRAMDRAQRLEPGLADHIWAELINEAGLTRTSPLASLGSAQTTAHNGRSAPRPWRGTAAEPAKPAPRRSSISHLATAAVIVLALVAGLIAVRLAAPEPARNVLDAVHRPAVETLVDAVVDNPAATWTPLVVERWTFRSPDATLAIPPLDGPQWLVAEERGLIASVGDSEQRLSPGVGIVIPAGQDLRLRNAGVDEVSALRGAATARFALEEYDQALITKQSALNSEAHEALPPGASRVVLERLTLLPESALLLEPASGQDWVAIVSGTLGLTLTGNGLPTNWQAGREREVGVDESLPALRPGTRATLRNIGDDALILLRLRVLPADPLSSLDLLGSSGEAPTLEFLWESEGGSDPLELPYGMDVDPQGNLWVSDSGNDRFQIIAPDGTHRGTWGASGSANGEFEFLSGNSSFGRPYGDIAFDTDGSFFVADTGNARIQKFAPDRTFMTAWGSEGRGEGEFLTPISIAVGPNGMVYVCDEVRNDVQMFDRDGRFLGVFGGAGMDPGQLMTPSGVAVDGEGNVWVADWSNDRIQRFDADGTWLAAWGEYGKELGQLDGPNDVVVDERGLVYVADALNNRIQVFSPEGEFVATAGKAGTGPEGFRYALGLALGEEGVVYVSDRQRVQAFRLLLPQVEGQAP